MGFIPRMRRSFLVPALPPVRGGSQSIVSSIAASFRSPVRIRIASRTGRTKILPSPAFPVLFTARIVLTIVGTTLSGTTIVSIRLGTSFGPGETG